MGSKANKNELSRIFTGSWFLVIAPPIIAFLVIWSRVVSDDVIETKWLVEFLIYMVGGSVLYYFASRVPIKVVLARAKRRKESEDGDKPSLSSLFFTDFFKNTEISYGVYDGYGNHLRNETEVVYGYLKIFSLPFYMLLYLFILIVKASLVFYWAIFSFIRNYIYLWVFPKKSGYKD